MKYLKLCEVSKQKSAIAVEYCRVILLLTHSHLVSKREGHILKQTALLFALIGVSLNN